MALPVLDEEMGDAVGAGFATADALLMGRVLYDEWAAYWPEHADQPFGDVMNSIKKYVVASSLHAAERELGDPQRRTWPRRLTDIKAGDGGDITMSGSATTLRWLAAHSRLCCRRLRVPGPARADEFLATEESQLM